MKYFILTYGCQMNESDSERIETILNNSGHKPAKNEQEANLIVINACSVRQTAIHRVFDKINKLYKTKKIILAGCVLESDKNKIKNKISEFWPPDKYFECTPIHQSKSTAYVPIMTGCNNFCSYCVVPYTRGREKSRPARDIVNEVKSLIKKGYKEIILLGQNVNSYKSQITEHKTQTKHKTENRETKTTNQKLKTISFNQLLKLINDMPGEFWLSFMTSHPKDMTDELINTMAKCKKLRKELHLPVQSGDNQILKKMNRHYTAGLYKKLIKKIRKAIPGIRISTDIIVGFPGETKKQFQNTFKLAKEIKFDKAYIAKYSSREGTVAAKLKDNVSLEEKKRRWQILDTLINKFKH